MPPLGMHCSLTDLYHSTHQTIRIYRSISQCFHCTLSALSSELGLFIFITIAPSKVLNSSLLNEWITKQCVRCWAMPWICFLNGKGAPKTANLAVLFYICLYVIGQKGLFYLPGLAHLPKQYVFLSFSWYSESTDWASFILASLALKQCSLR